MEEAPAPPSSAQQPVTLGLSHLSLSKAGRRDLIVARVTHALFVLNISPEVGEECALAALTLNQFETGRTAFSQSGSRGPCSQDQDEALSSQGGGPGPSSHRLSLLHLLHGSAFAWGTLMIEIPVRHGGIGLSLQQRLRQVD